MNKCISQNKSTTKKTKQVMENLSKIKDLSVVEKKQFDEIKGLSDDVQGQWKMLEAELTTGSPADSMNSLAFKKEGIKNFLEKIRKKIETILLGTPSECAVTKCEDFLKILLQISEGLRVSYMFPGYVESFYILDTIKYTLPQPPEDSGFSPIRR